MQKHYFNVEGKTIIVTGATSGLGWGLSLALAQAGANIVAAGRSEGKLDELVAAIEAGGGAALGVRTDVTSKDDVDGLLNAALEKFKAVDVLLNNAGMSIPGLKAEDVTEEQMQTIMDTNFKGVFLCGTTVARHMLERGKGKIINMSSAFGQAAWVGASIYCVSKAAIDHLTRAWALEWSARGVTVNSLAPAFVVTEMNRHLFAKEEYNERVLRHLPIGRLGQVEDLVGPTLFLSSSASDFMTGHVMSVDGGWTCV